MLAQVTPLAIAATLQVEDELRAQIQEAQRLRAQQVERARYAAELTQRRLFRVEPENRLVADVLEADWNARLREVAQVQEAAQRQDAADQQQLSEHDRARMRALIADFPQVWHDPRTADRDRKRLLRVLGEDVTLRQDDVITAHVRFTGGAIQTITVPVSQGRRSAAQVIALIDQLLEDDTDAQVAEQLNQRGERTYEGHPFPGMRIVSLRRAYHLKDHGMRLRERGRLSAEDAAKAYGVSRQTIMEWGRAGIIPMERINEHGMAVFPPPDAQAPKKGSHNVPKAR